MCVGSKTALLLLGWWTIGSTFDDHLLVRSGADPVRGREGGERAISHRGTEAHNAGYCSLSQEQRSTVRTTTFNARHQLLGNRKAKTWVQSDFHLSFMKICLNSLLAKTQITQLRLVSWTANTIVRG